MVLNGKTPPNHSVYLYNLHVVEKKDWLLLLLFCSQFFHFMWKL